MVNRERNEIEQEESKNLVRDSGLIRYMLRAKHFGWEEMRSTDLDSRWFSGSTVHAS